MVRDVKITLQHFGDVLYLMDEENAELTIYI
jgi:hypothetical protein